SASVDAASTPLDTLSLHDALPISGRDGDHSAVLYYHNAHLICAIDVSGNVNSRLRSYSGQTGGEARRRGISFSRSNVEAVRKARSEEHTSELQSRENLVCRLLLEK